MEAAENIELEVVDASGKKVGSRKVPASIFAAQINEHLLHQVVRWQRAKARAGTHKSKTRAEVRGGGAKPWRQKGTGRARAGSSTSPVWVGGGTAHGPRPRSYEFRLNKTERKKALCCALSARVNEGKLSVLQDFGLSEIKTKQAKQVLNALGIDGEKVVVIIPDGDETSAKSLRNIARTVVHQPAGLNVYDVINAQSVVIVDAALPSIQTRLES
ncbi:MAG: 50S ribosomal protein L4 [Bdellovibrionales bacterium]|nr:50S ribosomal protein L4 [Bdellovibrionales bacterium]